jgi:hypothetical protein
MNKKSVLIRAGLATAACALFLSLGVGAPPQTSAKSKDVYVCGCMKTASCPCAAMANKAGNCPCRDQMKAVPRHGKWAATNRKELYR